MSGKSSGFGFHYGAETIGASVIPTSSAKLSRQVDILRDYRSTTLIAPPSVAFALAEYLEEKEMIHTRGKPYHPQTQGKIERYHRTMKNVVKLRNYYQSEVLERELERFVNYYNNERAHESLQNVTPADVYHGRHYEVLSMRAKIKRVTLKGRKKENLAAVAA